MWIVESKIFESHKEAQEHASKLNKSKALIEQIEVSELLDPIKPTRITHMEDEFGMPLCSQGLIAKFTPFNTVTTVFPHKVTCIKCLEILEQEDEY